MKNIILVGTLPINENNFTYTDGQAESFKYLVEILSKEKVFNIVIVDILRK